LTVKPEQVSDVSLVRVAVKNFPAWQSIKTLTVTIGEQVAEATVNQSDSGIQWAEFAMDASEASEIEIAVADVWKNSTYTAAAIAEIEVYGEGASTDGTRAGAVARELEYSVDYKVKKQTGTVGDWQYAIARAFDHNSATVGGLGNMATGYIIFEFAKPTDVTKIGFRNSVNGDWALPKEIMFKVYNEDNIYRDKLVNPEPITDGVIHTAKQTGEEQEILLEGDIFKRVTHLMMKMESGYISGSGATWGGWVEMWIHGSPCEDGRPTNEIIATQLKSNVEILCDMGIVDGEPSEEYMQGTPTRLDMAKSILRLKGVYEDALSYHGTFNFADADAENYNLLSYIYAYKEYGFDGDGNNNFLPYEPLTARACYKLLLNLLGYECGKDFSWDELQSLCYKLGIGDMVYEETFTNKDMCNAIYEAFHVPLKDTQIYFVDYLYNAGRIPEGAWKKICDKQDRSSPVLDGEYENPPTVSKNGDFTFTFNENEHVLGKGAFAYNTPFHYAGIYYGTLPESDPRSKKKEFGEAMTKAGARAMRFPGGLPAHQYFIEGEEYAIQYDQKCKRFGMPWNGLYNSDDYNNAWYVDFWNWLDFCKEYDIDPIFQMNPSFFVDEAGEVRQAYPCFIVKPTDAGLITSDELYDHNRIDEAIAAFEKNVKEIADRGYEIHYWEIGNEDEYKNWYSIPASDPANPLAQDFCKAVTGYVRIIEKYFPGSYIMAPAGFNYKALLAPEDYVLIDAVATHYPFGKWTSPPNGETTNATALGMMNEQNFVRNFSKEAMREYLAEGRPLRADTETMTWRFQGWDPNSLMHTFAQALNTAHNWGELVFDSGFIGVNVMHDLESPWFGSVIYDVSMDPGNRYMRWNQNVTYTVHPDDLPDLYKFEDSYYYNPQSKAFELLGRHCGERVLTNSQTNVERRISGYASVDEENNEVRFTIVNRFDESIPVKIALPNIKVSAQTVNHQVMRSDYLRAVLEVEYENYETTMEVQGNAENSEQNAIEFEATPYSINQFVIKLDSIQK